MIFYGLLYQNTAKPYITRFQAYPFSAKAENAPKRERRKEQKEEPAADIDRKQAHGGGGEIRTHVPVRTT